MANSVDPPDQIPHFAASDLRLHCLPVTLTWDAGHKWVNLSHSRLNCCLLGFFRDFILSSVKLAWHSDPVFE